jgi:aconitate hydratase
VQEPPFFVDLSVEPAPIADIKGARVLGLFGDSVTTDHISPAGSIAVNLVRGIRWDLPFGGKSSF